MHGVYTPRSEPHGHWNYCISDSGPAEATLEQALESDMPLLGPTEAVETRYRERYLPVQQPYVESVHPRKRAKARRHHLDAANPLLLVPQHSRSGDTSVAQDPERA